MATPHNTWTMYSANPLHFFRAPGRADKDRQTGWANGYRRRLAHRLYPQPIFLHVLLNDDTCTTARDARRKEKTETVCSSGGLAGRQLVPRKFRTVDKATLDDRLTTVGPARCLVPETEKPFSRQWRAARRRSATERKFGKVSPRPACGWVCEEASIFFRDADLW